MNLEVAYIFIGYIKIYNYNSNVFFLSWLFVANLVLSFMMQVLYWWYWDLVSEIGEPDKNIHEYWVIYGGTAPVFLLASLINPPNFEFKSVQLVSDWIMTLGREEKHELLVHGFSWRHQRASSSAAASAERRTHQKSSDYRTTLYYFHSTSFGQIHDWKIRGYSIDPVLLQKSLQGKLKMSATFPTFCWKHMV